MRYRFLIRKPLYEPDTGTGSGSGGSGGTQQAAAQGNQGGADRQDLQGLLARHQGDAMAVIATLLSENHSLRDERRTLRGQLPAEGATVLTSEQAAAYQAYQQLGALADVQTALKERDTTAGDLKTLKRDLELRDVAAVSGYNLDVLRTLAGDAAFLIKDETKDGKSAKVVTVKDGDKETPLDDYAKTKWAAFLPALKPQVEQARVAHGTPRQAERRAGQQGAQEQERPRRSMARL
jgi:hypothetical protein